MIGTIIGLIIVCIIAGFLWWAIQHKLFPLIYPYLAEPFITIIQVLLVGLLVAIVIWAIVTLLGTAGIRVPRFGF